MECARQSVAATALWNPPRIGPRKHRGHFLDRHALILRELGFLSRMLN